ncbi:uncharacterized protein LOC112462153, partial [Temnothorax curvispinosus]
CFKQIADNLINLRKLATNDEPYLLSDTYHEERNSFRLMEIIALKKQHLAINDAVQMLKMVFSLHLLSTIVMTFTQIIFNLYFYVVRIQGGSSMSTQERHIYDMAFVTAVTYYSVKMLLIVWACETGKNEAMKISSTVHDVFNSTNNKQIKYEVN